jgi:catalase
MARLSLAHPAEFLELMQAQIAGPAKIEEFLAAHPAYVPILQAIDSVPPPRSWATIAFNSLNAFKLVNAHGDQQYVAGGWPPRRASTRCPRASGKTRITTI